MNMTGVTRVRIGARGLAFEITTDGVAVCTIQLTVKSEGCQFRSLIAIFAAAAAVVVRMLRWLALLLLSCDNQMCVYNKLISLIRLYTF